MGQISQFLRKAEGAIAHFCPACRELHVLCIDRPDPITGITWEWDGNIVAPTLSPAVALYWVQYPTKKIIRTCHYTLIKGELRYQKDCTHILKGITVMLPALPEYLRDKCLI